MTQFKKQECSQFRRKEWESKNWCNPWRQYTSDGGLLRSFLDPTSIKDTEPKENQLIKTTEKPVLGRSKALGRFSDWEKMESSLLRSLGFVGTEQTETKEGKEALGWETWWIGNNLGARDHHHHGLFWHEALLGNTVQKFGTITFCSERVDCAFGWNENEFHSGKWENTRQRKLERKEAPSLAWFFFS